MPMKRDRRPLISVLMGVYYQRKSVELLQRSIQSVLLQTNPDFELVICDDGSTNAAKKVVDAFAQSDARVHLARRDGLISLPEKLNACLETSSGPLIARMDDDDYAHPDRFEKQAAYLERHPEIGFVGSDVNLWKNGAVSDIRRLPERPGVRDFLFVQPFIHPALMFRRDALLAVGGYSEDKRCRKCEDYDLLLRLYEHGYQGANLRECLLDYSLPDTAKGSRTMGDRWNEAVTRWRHFNKLDLLPGALPYVVKPLAVGLLPERLLAALKNARRENA